MVTTPPPPRLQQQPSDLAASSTSVAHSDMETSSSPFRLRLLADHQTKTIDFGSNGVTASLSPFGRFVGIFAPHPEHGQIVTVPWAQFPGDKLYDQPFVRHYRAFPIRSLTDPTSGFGLTVEAVNTSGGAVSEPPPRTPDWYYADGSWPGFEHSARSGVETTSSYTVVDGSVVQTIRARNSTDTAQDVNVSFGGSFSVHRAPYTQLTPQGICSMPEFENVLTANETLTIYNRYLPSTLQAGLFVNGEAHPLRPQSSQSSEGPIEYSFEERFHLGAGEESTFTIVYKLSPEASPQPVELPSVPAVASVEGIDYAKLSALLGGGSRGDCLAFIVLRNIDYLIGCCAIPVSSDAVCIIADHQCLPLGWNRDNYWQLRLLYDMYEHIDEIASSPKAAAALRVRLQWILRSHLRWVFDWVARPSGFWGRSLFITGQPKDQVFQLDQQCYPLLELAEYAQVFAADGMPGREDELEFVRGLAAKHVDKLLSVLQRHRWTVPHSATTTPIGAPNGKVGLPVSIDEAHKPWLFKTEETPADDLVAFPYHFSSHILLWRTLSSLAGLQARLQANGDSAISAPLPLWARSVRRDTLHHFTTTNPATQKPMFAYLTSTTGEYQFYHDANDLPTVMAVEWGFCPPEPEWHNTLAFAFSRHNTEGYYPGGRYGGLGSVHTRDPWPLGDAQLLVVNAMYANGFSTGANGTSKTAPNGADSAPMPIPNGTPATAKLTAPTDMTTAQALDKLIAEVQWDGLFSEAIDRQTGVVTSKHWFSWPGSFVSSALVRNRDTLRL